LQPSLFPSRGPLTDELFSAWSAGRPPEAPHLPRTCDPLTDDDLQLALWACYNLHHRGFAGVPDAVEWDPATLAFRAVLEERFEESLRWEHKTAGLPSEPVDALRTIAEWGGPPLASFVEVEGTIEHLRELAIHRSAYQLKEADPHTWAIPRLSGSGRSAMIEIQADEYGQGVPGDAHAELFAAAMVDLGLNPTFGAYVADLPGETLATDNLVSMFGLNRRLRGALVGHLALFEMCSVSPMTRYLLAARRIGGLPSLEKFYEVHVEVDAHHAKLALDEMAAGFVADEPELGDDVVFGAAALSHVEARFARRLLRAWADGTTCRYEPEPAAPRLVVLDREAV
jgi:hypothetical protein